MWEISIWRLCRHDRESDRKRNRLPVDWCAVFRAKSIPRASGGKLTSCSVCVSNTIEMPRWLIKRQLEKDNLNPHLNPLTYNISWTFGLTQWCLWFFLYIIYFRLHSGYIILRYFGHHLCHRRLHHRPKIYLLTFRNNQILTSLQFSFIYDV